MYVCKTETHSRIFIGERNATFTKTHNTHSDRSPTNALLSVSHQQRIPLVAA